MMRVDTYQAHNILRIADLDWNLRGKHLFLVGGKNEQGKTSAITALLMALCGKRGCDWPAVALRDGEDEGWVKVNLSDDEETKGLTIELGLTRKRGGQIVESFRVTDQDGQECPTPRALLDRLFQLRGFDPLEFERMNPKEQRRKLLAVIGVDVDAFKAKYEVFYRDRESVNREGKQVRARYDATPVDAAAPAEEVSVSVLLSLLEAAQKVNAQNANERAHHEKMEAELNGYDAAIRELEAKLAVMQATRQDLQVEVRDHVAVMSRLQWHDESDLRTQLAGAEEANRKFTACAARKALASELEGLRRESQTLTEKMDAIRAEETSLLRAAKWPIDGLSVDAEGVLYQGLPLAQVAKSRRTEISARIGMALNPKLRLLVCQGGSDLDEGALSGLDQLMRDGDFQMILELVTRGESDEALCQVLVEDGVSMTQPVGETTYE